MPTAQVLLTGRVHGSNILTCGAAERMWGGEGQTVLLWVLLVLLIRVSTQCSYSLLHTAAVFAG